MKRIQLVLFLAFVVASAGLLGCRSEGSPQRDDGSAADLYSAASTLDLPYREYGSVNSVDGQLYLIVDVGNKINDTIVSVDPKTGQRKIVMTWPEEISWMRVNQEWLVWESDKEVMARPRRGGETSVVASSQPVFAPALDGGTVAWMDLGEDGEYDVVFHDLATGSTHKVADIEIPSYYNAFMDLEDGRLLWTDVRDGEGYYRVAQIGGVNPDEITVEDFPVGAIQFQYPGYALAFRDRFYSINFDNYYEWDWSVQQFGYYSTATSEFRPVIVDRAVYYFEIIGSRVAVVDSRQHLLMYDATDMSRHVNLTEESGVRFEMIFAADHNTLVAVEFRDIEQEDGFTLHVIEVE